MYRTRQTVTAIASTSSSSVRAALIEQTPSTSRLHLSRRWASDNAASTPAKTERVDRERNSVIIDNIPNTYTPVDLHRVLKRIGAMKNGDLPIDTIVAEFQPVPAPNSITARPSTTSFHITFRDTAQAESARKLIQGHAHTFLRLKGEPRRVFKASRVATMKRKAIVVAKQKVEGDRWYADRLRNGFMRDHIFPPVDLATGKPVPRNEASKRTESGGTEGAEEQPAAKPTRTLGPMPGAERERISNDYIQAFKDARIGIFGTDAKMKQRGQGPMSGRQVVMWGLPDRVKEVTWTRILKDFKLAEEDPIFAVPKQTKSFRSQFIITLQNVNEAHRLARKLHMFDFQSDVNQPRHLLRAQVLW